MKNILKHVIFSITIVLSILLLTEIILRFIFIFYINTDIETYRYAKLLKQKSSNPNLFFEPKPNTKAKIMGVNVHLNEYGMRYKNISKEKDEIKILCIGSSTTFGWGVQEEDIYTNIVEKKFKETNKNIKMINCGVVNYNISEISTLLKQNFHKINPDYVLLTYTLDDIEIKENNRTNNSFILNNSYLYAICSVKLKKLMFKLHNKTLSDYYTDLYNSYNWNNTEECILNMKDFCLNNNSKLLVVIIPDLHAYKDKNITNKFVDIYKKINNFFEKNNISYINIQNYYNEDFDKITLSPYDSHPNSKGHQIIGNIIYEFLYQKIIDNKFL